MTRRRWLWLAAAVAVAIVCAGLLVRPRTAVPPAAASADPRTGVATGVPSGALAANGLGASIVRLQDQLTADPGDATGWATLGVYYVQQAKNTVDPMYYPKAAGALGRALRLGGPTNLVALIGMADLRAAQHRFTDALAWARRAVRIDPDSSAAYGAIDDALTQLGRYGEAARAAQRMVDLQPGTPSFARASYVLELRGKVAGARADMLRAFTDAPTPSDKAFAAYYLGELSLNAGDPRTALRWQRLAAQVDPTYPDALEGAAKAEAALGMRPAAVRDFTAVVARVPQPTYVIEAGDYLASIGRTAQAQTLYRLFTTENRLFTSNGVRLDVDPTLFFADHGRPRLALRYATAGIRARPFLEMADAYAWALHVNHRDRAALVWSRRARGTGMRNALFAFHAGVIEHALGDDAAARRDLATALRVNPFFNPLQAPTARRLLAAIGGTR
jgi:tetratricopeptide (TPR) repeat protein